MFDIDEKDKTIYLTRGDMATIIVNARNANRRYTFRGGDVVRFRITNKGNYNDVRFTKDVTVKEETQNVEITLDREETKLDEITNREKEYWYEIELNPDTAPQTIVGFDKDGAKKLILYPEGGDLK